jgi:predicted dehydrogenase
VSKNVDYALSGQDSGAAFAVPEVPYKPRDPKDYRPKIGLIGCGGITKTHLSAYKTAGYKVVALCDAVEAKARDRQREFYPEAAIFTDYRELLRRDDIEVVDIATHPPERAPIIEAALLARKHVLSQKPYVLDLDLGERLADLAGKQGVKIAVNQNGRWAPHFSYMRNAISAGLIGQVCGAHLSVHWSHNWIAGTEFDKVRHIILYDFAIHWFDIVSCFMEGRSPLRVYASFTPSPAQRAKPALLAQAMIEYEGAQVSLAFDADTPYGRQDRTYIAGTQGSLSSIGPNLGNQTVTLHGKAGMFSPALEGSWFPVGFHGAMSELLCAIEEKREPSNSARNNLKGLGLCFAAVQSAEERRPVTPGSVRAIPIS